jgi:hypothetical protein
LHTDQVDSCDARWLRLLYERARTVESSKLRLLQLLCILWLLLLDILTLRWWNEGCVLFQNCWSCNTGSNSGIDFRRWMAHKLSHYMSSMAMRWSYLSMALRRCSCVIIPRCWRKHRLSYSMNLKWNSIFVLAPLSLHGVAKSRLFM